MEGYTLEERTIKDVTYNVQATSNHRHHAFYGVMLTAATGGEAMMCVVILKISMKKTNSLPLTKVRRGINVTKQMIEDEDEIETI